MSPFPPALPDPATGDAAGVLDVLSEGVVRLHPCGRIELNRAAQRLLGAEDEQAARDLIEGRTTEPLLDASGNALPRTLLELASLTVSGHHQAGPTVVRLPVRHGGRWIRLRRHELAGASAILIADVTAEVTVERTRIRTPAHLDARERMADWGGDFTIGYPELRGLFLSECLQLTRGTGAILAQVRSADALVEEARGIWESTLGSEILTGELADDGGISGELLSQRVIQLPARQELIEAAFPLAADAEGLVCVSVASGTESHARMQLADFLRDMGPIMAHRHTLDLLETGAKGDPLTGLPNLAEFFMRAEQAAEDARRRRRPLAIVMLSIDELGQINRIHGHEVGDQVIAGVAERLERVVMGRRGRNLMARLGGGTFSWLMVDADAILAETTAELARTQLLAAPFPVAGMVTVSAGVCDYDDDRDTSQVMRLANGSLYWAKSHGRDQVCRYRPDVVSELTHADTVSRLEREVSRNSLRALAKAIDLKDPQTREHSVRVARLADQLARELGWDDRRRTLLCDASLVHDVGKIGISDSILFKPDTLTSFERELIEQHPVMGARICAEFLEPEQTAWIRSHHERWDGTGYPDGLAGERIPDGARLMFVADAMEAMTARRPYRDSRWLPESVEECRREAGRQFDPQVVDALMRLAERRELDWLSEDTTARP